MSKRKTPTSSSNDSNSVNKDEIVNYNSNGDTANPVEIAHRKIKEHLAQMKNEQNVTMELFNAGIINEEQRNVFFSRSNEIFDVSKKKSMNELSQPGLSVIDLTEEVKLEEGENDINNNSNSSSSSSSSNRMQSPATGRGNNAADINDDEDEDHKNLHCKNSSTTPPWILHSTSSNKRSEKNASTSANPISPRSPIEFQGQPKRDYEGRDSEDDDKEEEKIQRSTISSDIKDDKNDDEEDIGDDSDDDEDTKESKSLRKKRESLSLQEIGPNKRAKRNPKNWDIGEDGVHERGAIKKTTKKRTKKNDLNKKSEEKASTSANPVSPRSSKRFQDQAKRDYEESDYDTDEDDEEDEKNLTSPISSDIKDDNDDDEDVVDDEESKESEKEEALRTSCQELSPNKKRAKRNPKNCDIDDNMQGNDNGKEKGKESKFPKVDKELIEAAKMNDIEKVNQCLENGTKVNATDYKGRTALHW
eukprot:CAMPEP_0119041098 /NCGR_PEP_ID=MMETSP1177-20130426/11249_1 /TAXON_ID=2985 /ORGANISM="Ochromonas sp, Strain CCMP1899" /LENGTH=473 /DNA_ID=CAMNT_0007006835 /DNA_START=74 /DNA_END=1492 /DNA_ORIENTATION=-